MAYKIMGKNKISKESKNLKTARDKGVNSSDWLEDRTTIIWNHLLEIQQARVV